MLEMDRQEKACKKFMATTLMFLGVGLFIVALTMRTWETSNKDIDKGFFFLGLCMVLTSLISLITIIFAIKWVKDENDIKFLLKRLRTIRRALEVVAFVVFLFLIIEFWHLAELLNQDEDGDEDGDEDDDGDEDENGDEDEMPAQLVALILFTSLTLILCIYYHRSLIRWNRACQEVMPMARPEQNLQERTEQINHVPSASVDAQNVGAEEEQKDVEEGKEDDLPAYDDLFPEEDATHPYFYKMLQSV